MKRHLPLFFLAFILAACSAYKELTPDPPLTPLERGYIELKKDTDLFVLEKEGKYYIKFPGPVKDKFLLVLTTDSKWALDAYLTKYFDDGDGPIIRITDDAESSDSLFVYTLEMGVQTFYWVIDTVKMDVELSMRYRYVPHWRYTFETFYSDLRGQLADNRADRSTYAAIDPEFSFATFDFNEEQVKLELTHRNLTDMNKKLLALATLFPPDIASSRDTAYENYLELKNDVARELEFQTRYATVLDVFEKERDSRGNTVAFLAAAPVFVDFMRGTEIYPGPILTKGRTLFLGRLNEAVPYYEGKLRAKRDATPISLDPPLEPVVGLYAACGSTPPSELTSMMEFVEHFNTEADALAGARKKLGLLAGLTGSGTQWRSDSLYIDLLADASAARSMLPQSQIDRYAKYAAFPCAVSLKHDLAFAAGEASAYQSLYQTSRTFLTNLNAGSWMTAETILRDLHTGRQFVAYPSVNAQKNALVREFEDGMYNRVLSQSRARVDDFVKRHGTTTDNISVLYSDPVFTPVYELTFSAGGQQALTAKKKRVQDYLDQAKYVVFPEGAIKGIYDDFTRNVNDRGVEKARAIVEHGKYYRGEDKQVRSIVDECDVTVPKWIVRPKEYRRVFALPVTSNRQGSNEYMFRILLQIPSSAQFPVFDVNVKLPADVARRANREQWYESITINDIPIKNEGRFRITAPTAENGYESLITPVQMDKGGKNILEVRFTQPGFKVFEVSAMAQVPIIRKN
ncbi:MAG: hypothetical protein WBG01_15270 [Bacteroidota bacterium]